MDLTIAYLFLSYRDLVIEDYLSAVSNSFGFNFSFSSPVLNNLLALPFFQGASFSEVIQMTDIFEGSIIRSARRLDEFLNQVNCEIFTLKRHVLIFLCLLFKEKIVVWSNSIVPKRIVSPKSFNNTTPFSKIIYIVYAGFLLNMETVYAFLCSSLFEFQWNYCQ
jgi:hypothetical protein